MHGGYRYNVRCELSKGEAVSVEVYSIVSAMPRGCEWVDLDARIAGRGLAVTRHAKSTSYV